MRLNENAARVGLASAALCCLVNAASPAFAQVAPPPPAPAEGKADQIAEIIVTAQRRAERLQDVPVSITALSGSTIQTAGIARFEDLGRITPGLRVDRLGSRYQPAIRGISVLVVAQGNEPNVATYVDGFYQPNDVVYTQDLVNLSSVEVLKGPQGSLYGRNATGGVILLETIDPKPEFAASASAAYATFHDLRLSGVVSTPLGQNLTFGVTGYYRRNHGYLRDITGYGAANVVPSIAGQDRSVPTAEFSTTSIRAKLKYEPTSNLTIKLGYNHLALSNGAALAYIIYQHSPLAAVAGNVLSDNRDHTALTTPPVYKNSQDEATLAGDLTVSDAVKISTRTSYLRYVIDQTFDFDGTLNNAFVSTTHEQGRYFIQALDATIKPLDNLVVLGGVQYFHAYAASTGVSNFASGATRVNSASFVKTVTDAYAGYLDATYEAVPHLFLTGGVRYSSDLKKVRAEAPPGTLRPGGAAERRFDSTTFRAVGRYEFGRNVNVYASFSQGFKSGIFNTLGTPNSVSPEKVNAYEVGVKAAVGRFNANLAVFHYDYRNLQVQSLIDALTVILTNAASAKIDGGELQIEGRITDNLSARAGITHLHARYDKFTTASGILIGATGFNTSPQSQNWSGLQMPRAADWSGNLGLTLAVPDVLSGGLEFSTDGFATTGYYPSNESYIPSPTQPSNPQAGTPRYRENGYVVVNGQIKWSSADKRFDLAVFSENITNTRYKVTNAGGTYGDYQTYNTPRVVGVRVGLRY
jgi:iron complex outermembrane receptor protein